MKRTLLIVLSLALSLQFFSCKKEDLPAIEQEEITTMTSVTETAEQEIIQPNIDDMPHYKNPIIKVNDKNTWVNYGVGDPFVMRYNGRYYLYCSTKDGSVGIQCWSSTNLVDWTFCGVCASEQLTMSAYAPEVVYYNGHFYMYTSPAGKGHYVLKSDSPTGPFLAITDNFGLSIDGHIFIDDDGKWYFYVAAQGGIMVYPMSAPSRVDALAGKKIACDMNGWTEGAMIVKYDDTYYMTYAGNHVWSTGYRINYAVSNTTPLDFQPAEGNPLLLSTDQETVMGIGHSSTVIGPNLDEYYIVYHSFKSAPQRSMNIDRIVFNGTDTHVLGPSTANQQAPKMPDLYAWFETEAELNEWEIVNGALSNGNFVLGAGGKVLSRKGVSGDYTAEYNIKSVSDQAGILFGYRDEQNHGRALYNASSNELTIEFRTNGTTTQHKIALAASFSELLRSDALIKLGIRKSGNEYTFFINDRKVLCCENALGSGSIGVFCEAGSASVGFVGATNGSFQSTIKDVYKPIESTISAFSCLESEAELLVYDGVRYLHTAPNVQYSYNTNVTKDGIYDIVFEYKASENFLIEVYQNGEKLGDFMLPTTSGGLGRRAVRGVSLTKGIGTVSLVVKKGSADILNFTPHLAKAVPETTYDFNRYMKYSYKDGDWSLANGALVLNSRFGKYMVGSEDWGNYIVESDITITSDSANAGLCVRVSNPSSRSDAISSGSDYLQGYFIGFGNGSLFLGKHNYNWKELKSISFHTQQNKTYRLKVEVDENRFRISVDGKLVMTYTDESAPFLHGMVGYRSHDCRIAVDNLSVHPIS